MIKVTTQGGQTIPVEYQKGMLVINVLDAAQITETKNSTISVDGKDANSKTPVNDNSLVVITPNISNG